MFESARELFVLQRSQRSGVYAIAAISQFSAISCSQPYTDPDEWPLQVYEYGTQGIVRKKLNLQQNLGLNGIQTMISATSVYWLASYHGSSWHHENKSMIEAYDRLMILFGREGLTTKTFLHQGCSKKKFVR